MWSTNILQDEIVKDFALVAAQCQSVYGRYANDSLYAPLWDVAALQRVGNQVWWTALRVIAPDEDIYVEYGKEY